MNARGGRRWSERFTTVLTSTLINRSLRSGHGQCFNILSKGWSSIEVAQSVCFISECILLKHTITQLWTYKHSSIVYYSMVCPVNTVFNLFKKVWLYIFMYSVLYVVFNTRVVNWNSFIFILVIYTSFADSYDA